MTNEKLANNQEMNESDIKNALRLLRVAISRKIITYNHANPLKENCYISSGYISGLYFPNSEISVNNGKHKNYNFACIGLINYELCIIYSLKDDTIFKSLNEFISENLYNSIYSFKERQIINSINACIKDYTERLKTLENVKRVYKKNGHDFNNLNMCFTGCDIALSRSFSDYKITSVKISNSVTLFVPLESQKKDITASDIENLIKADILETKANIEQGQKALKEVYKNFQKMQKLASEVNSFFNSFKYGEQYIFKSVFINRMI